MPSAVPPVVAVVVTHDPGPWFDETLAGLAAQTYPDLSVLVVDTASTVDPAPRVLAALPGAHVHRLDHDPGFGAAANAVLALVEGASFYALCHDDVALEPDAVRILVEEAFRSNAGIIGPKLVDWDDPRRLLQVGMSVDKTGASSPIAERGELDQEQHDAVRDVFVVPGACTVVRADLFAALGGFDDGIVGPGDDVDLCWRAHAVGARVLVAPAARGRHLEALELRSDRDDRARREARHRLRTTLVAYGRGHRLRVIPQATLFAFVEAISAVLAGNPKQARDLLAAGPWNLRRMGAIRRRRRALDAARRVDDREIRGLQVYGSARFSEFLRDQMGERDARAPTVTRSSRDLGGALRDSSRQLTVALAVVTVVVLVVGSRGLLFGRLSAVGELARFPSSPGPLFEAWWSGWRRSGLGSAGAQPTGYAILGALGYLFFGAMGVLRAVLVLATIPLGAVGAWRLARPIGSTRASVAAFVVYLAIPVPYNALARGSWSGLALYAISPWMLLGFATASAAAPFGPKGATADDAAGTRPVRRLAGLVLGLGLGLALAGAVVPFVVVVALGVATSLLVGSLLVLRVAGLARLAAVSVGSTLVAVALHAPWSFDLLRAPSPWQAVAGVGSIRGGPLDLGRIVRFESGPWGAPPLGWAFLLAAALPVVIGRSWRLDWAVRAWVVAIAGWGLLWVGQRGDLPVGLPPAEVVLAPVAAAVALAVALGLAAFETDLRAYRFGWRQVLSVGAALGVLLAATPLASGLIDGRWRMPANDYAAGLDDLVTNQNQDPFRIVWVGDPGLLPAAGWRYDDATAYATTDRGVPTVLDRFAGPPGGATPLVADALRLVEDRRTDRLGRLLAPMGVRYVIVQSQLSPSSSVVSGQRKPPARLLDRLAEQLDLEAVPVSEGLLVYRNTAWVPSRAVLPAREGERTSFTDATMDDLSEAVPALRIDDGNAGAHGQVPRQGDLLVASTADDRWRLRIGGIVAARSDAYGWANQFAATRTGAGRLEYRTPMVRHLVSVVQAALWVLAFVAWRVVRRRERRQTDERRPRTAT